MFCVFVALVFVLTAIAESFLDFCTVGIGVGFAEREDDVIVQVRMRVDEAADLDIEVDVLEQLPEEACALAGSSEGLLVVQAEVIILVLLFVGDALLEHLQEV